MLLELLGVAGLREAVDVVSLTVARHRMPAQAETELLAELVKRLVAAFERCARGGAIPGQPRPATARPCGACSFTTSMTTKAHFGHSNVRNPSVLLSSRMAARQLGQLFSLSMRNENIKRTIVNRASGRAPLALGQPNIDGK